MTRRKATGASDRVLFDWTEDVLTKARALWDSGLSTRLIAKALGTSKNSLVGKAHRLGWPSRPSPIRAPTGRKPRIRRIVDMPTLPPLAHTSPLPIVVPPTASVAMRTCQWIDGEATRRAVFCGAVVRRGSSYCEAHHARSWHVYAPRNPPPEIGLVPVRDGRADDRRQAFLPD